jgi:hypothetical protein
MQHRGRLRLLAAGVAEGCTVLTGRRSQSVARATAAASQDALLDPLRAAPLEPVGRYGEDVVYAVPKPG